MILPGRGMGAMTQHSSGGDRTGGAERVLSRLIGLDLLSEGTGGLVTLALGVEPSEEVRRLGQITRGVGEVEELGV